ncbi:family A G protein-coupled receptor-like protein [Mollisia scopiformis]|uniref:Family A G protein-coupled receptor-like protein n=1 Tax=Mollisia scopiformis TaxID=149040 RepID=A0A132B380_MOLSC|nr:family A G protein-coupled receptor-like protein [Mollisia scopiformis]KUJ06856.1 family A G protein-coupled receptor-like protein [Mollisia scopiformis]
MALFPRANDALNINPPTGVDLSLSVHGSDWLWAVTAIYILSFFVCLVPSFTAPESKRVFNYTLSMALLVGSLTYFAQASNLGWSSILQTDNLTRQIFYARYINWVVSFPALVLSLGLLSGVSWTTVILNIFIAWFWILSYLAAAYTTTSYKWGFFAFGTFAYIILVMSTLNESRESAQVIGISRDYMILASWTNLLWLLYPIAFGLSDGGNVIGVAEAAIFFGVLDVLLLPVVSVGFLVLSRGWDFEKLQLDFSEYRGLRHGQASEEEGALATGGKKTRESGEA